MAASDGSGFRVRLREVLKQFGSVAELANAIEVSDNAIYKWLAGRGQPSLANLVALARAGRVSIEWLATGEENAPTGAGRSRTRREYVFLPRYDVHGPAVRGGPLKSALIVDYLAFKEDWMRTRLRAEPRNLLLMEMKGDSMAPTLSDGDLVLIDLSEPRYHFDGMYVLRINHELGIKRIQRRHDGSLLLRCDNTAYESSVVPPDGVRILGRVIWAAGSV